MHRFTDFVAVFLLAGAAFANCAFSRGLGITIAPDESASKDTFTYSAIPSGLPFGNATYLGASLESSGIHTVHSLIQFDIPDIGSRPIVNAYFRIFARSKAATPFASVASDPSSTSPVTVDLYRVTSSWDEATTTFSTEPSFDPAPLGTFVVNDINRTYEANVTSLVAGWLANPASNFGLELRQRAIVPVVGAPDAAVVFQSSGAANRPALTIVLPEPLSLASLAFIPMIMGRRQR